MVLRVDDPLKSLLALAPSPALRALTPKQRAAIAGSKRFRTWLAGRRAGKSYAAAIWLLGGKPGQRSAYCARTLKSAKAIILGVFAELNARFSLGLDIRIATGTITEPNGHVIQLYGLRDQSQANLIRGQKFRRVFIDELGAYPDDLLQYSIESVIQWTLVDLRGELIVAGTPGPIPKGYAFEMTGNPGLETPLPGRWPSHHWTFEHNPHVPREDVLQEAIEVNGWTEQSSTFLREFRAIWCEDQDAVIYRYKPALWQADGITPVWSPLPGPGRTVLALDFASGGGEGCDSTSWVIARQPHNSAHVFILEAIARDEIELPETAAITRELREKWSVNKIVADEGALGKALAKALRGQYRLPIEPAVKLDKQGRILSLRGRLSAETLHLCAGAEALWQEWRTLCWDETRTDHHPRMADDLSDGCLYAVEEFRAWQEAPKPPKVVDISDQVRAKAMQRALARSGGMSGL